MTYRTDWNSVVEADYVEALQPHLRGNPLIEALQPMYADEAMYRALRRTPKIAHEQRGWDTYARIPMLHTLSDFMVPLPRHLTVARYVETILRQGYIGRGPNTRRHVDVLNKIHHMRSEGIAVGGSSLTHASLTAAFVGLSGTAKTTIIRLVEQLFPKVIHHPNLRIWQVPILRVSFPADGRSLKGPLLAVYKALQSYLVDADYDVRASKVDRRTLADLPPDLAGVLHRHFVGLVVFDEVQNARHAPKDKSYLTALLVQLSNDLGVPIMFVGTNQVSGILADTMAGGRRSIGLGLTYWDRFLWCEPDANGDPTPADEWTRFFKTLWHYQWVRKPRRYTLETSALVHELTQGIPDVAIKLLAATQLRAMQDGSEQLTDELLQLVAERELKLIEPMLHALRTGDKKLLAKYDDLAPLRARLGTIEPIFDARAVPIVRGADITPASLSFNETLTDSMRSLGVPDKVAGEVAEQVAIEYPKTDAIRGMQHALRKLRPGQPKRAASYAEAPPPPAANLEPDDLRNALVAVGTSEGAVLKALTEIGVVFRMDELLETA